MSTNKQTNKQKNEILSEIIMNIEKFTYDTIQRVRKESS